MGRDEAAPGSQNLKDPAPDSWDLKDLDLDEESAVKDAIRGSKLWLGTRPQHVRPSRSEGMHDSNPTLCVSG
jgi:hypothetical protein